MIFYELLLYGDEPKYRLWKIETVSAWVFAVKLEALGDGFLTGEPWAEE